MEEVKKLVLYWIHRDKAIWTEKNRSWVVEGTSVTVKFATAGERLWTVATTHPEHVSRVYVESSTQLEKVIYANRFPTLLLL